MQAIILAAGMGKRLKELTKNNTKCMVEVNGITLIERTLRILDKKQLSRIVIVVGYKGKELMDFIDTLSISTPICYINNPIYHKTNNIYSLSLAKEYLCAEDTLLLESDLIFEENIIDVLLNDERETLVLVDKYASWMDGTCMELDENECITDFISGKHLNFFEKENYYKTVNIYKFSKHFSENTYIPFLCAYERAMGENEYYESVIKLISLLETKEIRAKRLNGQVWYEIDNIQDLNIAESLFANNLEEQYDMIMSRYGGFWRYPKLLDFCYLVNPYYPNAKLIHEMESNFKTLVTQYPSGMYVNSLLAVNNFGVKQEHIIVGNGAAELIRVLMEKLEGNVGYVLPTFNEYLNRYQKDKSICFVPDSRGFRYGKEDIISFFSDKNINTLIIINPDNPSGNYIKNEDLISLIHWCKEKDIRIIIDESFVDFAERAKNEEVTLIKENYLNLYDKLYIIKSISKSYGIPGLRLGVLASSDRNMIAELKKEVSIWNINSLGEYFMQIMEKYEKDYRNSLEKLRECRKELVAELQKISYLEVFPSDANYVMCEVLGRTSRQICSKLLASNILIKDLTPKISNGLQYIRISIRSKDENNKLIEALRKI